MQRIGKHFVKGLKAFVSDSGWFMVMKWGRCSVSGRTIYPITQMFFVPS